MVTQSASFTAAAFYVTGGTLDRDAPCYVVRRADNDLLEGLRRGQFCYVLTSRQMGKSSLMVRAATRLREEGVAVASLELTAIGQSNLTPEQWYGGLLGHIGRQLHCEDEVEAFWFGNDRVAPLQRFFRTLQEVLLAKVPGKIVLFLDEVDVVRSLPFTVDEFFAGIRECYNRRTDDPEMYRLTFCLGGAASPSDLIQDVRTTPFNIGTRVEPRDFTEEEAFALAAGLSNAGRGGRLLLKRVLYWTGGHPYLTLRLCRALAEDTSAVSFSDVDRHASDLFFSSRSRSSEDNLMFVSRWLLEGVPDRASLLDLYAKIRAGRRVVDDETSPLVNVLRLSGIVRTENGRLIVRNRIYLRVFDKAWVIAHMPDAELRRQKAAYRRGLFRAIGVSSVLLAIMGTLTGVAVYQMRRADMVADKATYNLYVDHMNLAQAAWEDNNVARVETLLKETEANPARGWEWGYFSRLCHLELKTLPYAGPAAAFSPSGDRIVAGCPDYTAKVWDAVTFRELLTLKGHTRPIDAVAFSPDGKRIVTVAQDDTAKVWNAETGQPLLTLPGKHGDRKCLALSSDGSRIAVGTSSPGNTGEVRVFDAKIGRRLLTVSESATTIEAVAFSPDGHRLYCGTSDQVVKIRNAGTGEEVRHFTADLDGVPSISISADGKQFATAGWNNTATVWNAVTGRKLFALKHPRPIDTIAYSRNGSRIVTGAEDNTAKVWDAATGRELLTLKGHIGHIASVAFSPDGTRILTGSEDNTVKIWDALDSRERRELKGPAGTQTSAVTFSSDGKRFGAAFSRLNPGETGTEGWATVWDVITWHKTQTLKEPIKWICSLNFMPDGSSLLASSWSHNDVNGKAMLWDALTGRAIFNFKANTGPCSQAAISPDGTQIVTASGEAGLRGEAAMWDAQTGRKLFTVPGSPISASSVAFSRDGTRLAIGRGNVVDQPGIVAVWDMRMRKERLVFKRHSRPVQAIAFSPDGKLIVTAAGDLGAPGETKVWDTQTGHELFELHGHTGTVFSVAFSPDGRRIATGSEDHTVRLWDAVTGRELLTFKGLTGRFTPVAFSPDGQSIATGSGDGTVMLQFSKDAG